MPSWEAFLDVVRHHEDGHAIFFPQPQDEFVHVGSYARIQRAERLIEQQDLGFADHSLCDGHALLHAAGELRRVACRATCARPD